MKIGVDSIINFNKVVKTYLINQNQSNVLNDITFNINEGEIFGILGDTGAGKSTILKLITGFVLPSSGTIKVFNEQLTRTSRKRLIKDMAVIFQNYNLLNNLTVLDNVLLPLKIRKKEKDIKKAIELLDFVGLGEFINEYPKTLSGGEKQRVSIARSLITNPKILLCDEPTSSLDINTSIDIINLLEQINLKYNTTIVLVSHQTSIIKAICNKALILDSGKIKDIISINKKSLDKTTYQKRLLND